ncbi:hypothetical protein HRE53_30585 (plasmid) [Acaryochloris sp. 'Moss Beach']|uniref:hypothetical protein n=1 Tax=Acaryochloris sp. 'Moss Beach' TaxID=2740837 RepID=UPI001F20858D|nr:hypothetical protein [Acaryochloris sp. 'Moss Beach']UJB72938.1 hypothetical protein HRE53_30585 [Acaryochloris sp. 'Moss Beach']
MIGIGQLDYIRSRDWYKDGKYGVEIDVNYYVNRPFGTSPLYWHKDTGGGNIFVNLIFNNPDVIVGTEWTADTQPMTKEKLETLEANMPEEQIKEIREVREAKTLKGRDEILTSLLKKYGYVSWVDELMWHSSPFMTNRKKWDKDLATKVMQKKVEPEPFMKMETATSYEAMVIINENQDTVLYNSQREAGPLDADKADGWWNQGYNLNGKYKKYVLQDVEKVKWPNWKVNEAFGHAQDAGDPRVNKPKEILSPAGLKGRKRALSDAKKQKEFAKYAEKETGRNFLRTWVRVKPLD